MRPRDKHTICRNFLGCVMIRKVCKIGWDVVMLGVTISVLFESKCIKRLKGSFKKEKFNGSASIYAV